MLFRSVGLRADGVRLILKSVETQVEGGEASVDSDSVMLVSGGARGVTAATVISSVPRPRPALCCWDVRPWERSLPLSPVWKTTPE